MTYKECIENLELMKSEIEWEYPIDWQLTFDKAIETCKRMSAINLVKEADNYLDGYNDCLREYELEEKNNDN